MTVKQTRDYVRSLMGGHEEDAMKASWNEVKNKDDWKGQIDVVLEGKTEEELSLYFCAVAHYTGARVLLSEEQPAEDGTTRVRITCAGYAAD